MWTRTPDNPHNEGGEEQSPCLSRRYGLACEKSNLGDFCVIDSHRNVVIDRRVDPKEMAREIGAAA
jgi:hypothetical protein